MNQRFIHPSLVGWALAKRFQRGPIILTRTHHNGEAITAEDQLQSCPPLFSFWSNFNQPTQLLRCVRRPGEPRFDGFEEWKITGRLSFLKSFQVCRNLV